jgi:hypothetical protein
MGVEIMGRLFDDDEIRRLSRRIASEFEETYGSFEEKVRRVSDDAAESIAKECEVHLEIGRVAYRVIMDGALTDAERCCSIIQQEFKRRERQGSPVPDVDSYIRSVAIREGQWIVYLYSHLGKELHTENYSLENLHQVVEGEAEPASENILAVIRQRRKIAEGYFESILNQWLADHDEATIADAVRAIIGGLRDLPLESVEDMITGLRASLLMKFRRYEKLLQSSEESDLMQKVLNSLQQVISEAQLPLEEVSRITAQEILVESLPAPPIAIDEKPKYGYIHHAFPRQARSGPEFKSAIDFLELDVWLAARRSPSLRAAFLKAKITKVVELLMEQGTPLESVGSQVIFDLDKRLPWKRSRKDAVLGDLSEIIETGGMECQTRIEEYILKEILEKIPQLRSTSKEREDANSS